MKQEQYLSPIHPQPPYPFPVDLQGFDDRGERKFPCLGGHNVDTRKQDFVAFTALCAIPDAEFMFKLALTGLPEHTALFRAIEALAELQGDKIPSAKMWVPVIKRAQMVIDGSLTVKDLLAEYAKRDELSDGENSMIDEYGFIDANQHPTRKEYNKWYHSARD